MRELTSGQRLQALARRWRRAGVRVGLVPTMGSLHEGHLSLVRRARRAVGPNGRVVVSIYVNPAQFGPQEDLARYPRNLPRDRQLCREAGVDALFVPTDGEMYPAPVGAAHSTYVVEDALSRSLEGVSRPTHFRGVTTVVAKLLNLALPEVAVFGAKDYQQAAVVGRMIRDLHFPVRLIVAPTVREPDGLALSSRNQYLNPVERAQANVLWRAICRAKLEVRARPPGVSAERLGRILSALIAREPAARLDYLAFFDPQTLTPTERVRRGTHLALAVFIGRTRLIDNARL